MVEMPGADEFGNCICEDDEDPSCTCESYEKEEGETLMENEIRFYLTKIKEAMEGEEKFAPTHLVTATKLPSGSVEIAINTDKIPEKIDYILAVYDEEMRLKSSQGVVLVQLMVV